MFFASFCLLVNISVAMTFLNISVWLKKQIEHFEFADILYLLACYFLWLYWIARFLSSMTSDNIEPIKKES